MHTNTPIILRRHRWFVALPLLAIMVLATLQQGLHPHVSADVTAIPEGGQITINASSSARTFPLTAGEIQLQPGSSLDLSNPLSPILRAGTALIVTDTLQHLTAGPLDLAGWNGAYQVTVTDSSNVTVAALTTPVAAMRDHAQNIVPAGMQWESATVLPENTKDMNAWLTVRQSKPLPDAYLEQQLPLAQTLSSSIPIEPKNDGTLHSFSFLQLPAAQSRSQAMESQATLNAMESDLQSGSTTTLDAVLQNPSSAATLFGSDAGQATLPLLLALAAQHDKDSLLLPYFMKDQTNALLASFHPLVRDHAWAMAQMSSPESHSLLQLVFMPFADSTPHAMSDLAVKNWEAASAAFLASRKDVSSILNAILAVEMQQVQHLADLTYPERAQQYSDAWMRLAQPYLAHLQPKTRAVFDAQKTVATASESSSAGSFSSASFASSIVSSVSISDLENRAHDQLVANGFMFTSQTSLHGRANGSVDVSSIVLSTKAGDQALDFTYNPLADAVSDITQNGKKMPYAISLKQYVEWLRGE